MDLDKDFYWDLSHKIKFDISKEPNPKNFEMGQLSFDLEDIEAIADGKNPPINYGFVWLSRERERKGKGSLKGKGSSLFLAAYCHSLATPG